MQIINDVLIIQNENKYDAIDKTYYSRVQFNANRGAFTVTCVVMMTEDAHIADSPGCNKCEFCVMCFGFFIIVSSLLLIMLSAWLSFEGYELDAKVVFSVSIAEIVISITLYIVYLVKPSLLGIN